MKSKTSFPLVLLLTCALLLPAAVAAKGGGGFRGGGSFGGGPRSSGFSRSGRSFSTPRASSPPAGSGGFQSSPGGGFATHYDSGAAAANRAQSSRSLYERANGINSGNSPGDRHTWGMSRAKRSRRDPNGSRFSAAMPCNLSRSTTTHSVHSSGCG
jgi:hypothetical protein